MSTSPQFDQYALGLDIGSNTFSCVLLKRNAESISVEQDASYSVRLSENLLPGRPLRAPHDTGAPRVVVLGSTPAGRRDAAALDTPLAAPTPLALH